MQIVYDDIIYILQKSGGISVYWSILERYMKDIKRLQFSGSENNIFYSNEEESSVSNVRFLERFRNLNLKNDKPFVFHSSYYRICKNANAINITTLHDFTYEYFRKDFKSILHKIQKRRAVMKSDGVICISENTKQDLLKFYPRYKGNIKVIYHGYDKNLFNYKDEQRDNVVLFVGSRAEYKGFGFTIDVLANIPDLKLIIVGGGDLTSQEIQLLNNKLYGRYEKLGFIDNEKLSELYLTSFALFYPSEYEGFGFPVIEAQACGCPVICQRKSSIPEVSGDKCIYVDSDNIEVSIKNVCQLFNDLFYKNLQEAGLENVKRFSWEKCVKETEGFYKTVAGRM